MPNTKQPGAFGNLIVKFDVRFPRAVPEASKQQLRAALPPS